ncbi:AT-hook motif nuclear-localized protein 17 [Sesamum angolense]|uniref:AT-hook motif nuclear-localized protein n=1 Tax=Sesamum angolense TaxID=2727404 RepID=A0AAE2BJH1_9LAMI|nr:AT-hook motif nuclear-localized protein 17 [Sesamum angolense]
MKRKCIEEDHPNPTPITMFSTPHHHHTPKFHLQTTTSEEADSHSSAKSNAKDDSFPPPPTTHDGATIEVVRRPRGRPPGSKNKPKPPVIITRDSSEPSMSPYVLELPAGVDVVESTSRFCRKRNMGLCVLNGNGVVANVTLKQPSATPGATVTFHGRFDILSLSATIFPAGGSAAGNGPFAICLAGPQGQVVGGHVVGPLVSAGTIYLIAATFNSPTFDRLQAAEHEDTEARDGAHDPHESPQTVSGADSGGAHIYSYQPSDVIWAPTARPPPPPPPY